MLQYFANAIFFTEAYMYNRPLGVKAAIQGNSLVSTQ